MKRKEMAATMAIDSQNDRPQQLTITKPTEIRNETV